MFIYRPGRNVPDLRERVGERVGRRSERESGGVSLSPCSVFDHTSAREKCREGERGTQRQTQRHREGQRQTDKQTYTDNEGSLLVFNAQPTGTVISRRQTMKERQTDRQTGTEKECCWWQAKYRETNCFQFLFPVSVSSFCSR